MKPQILLVDDEPDIRFGFSRYLTKAGYAVQVATNLADARDAISTQRFDAILLDLNLPDGNGLDWIPELRETSTDVALVVITGEGDMPVAVEALRRGADHFLTKPVSMLDLDVFLRKSLELGGLRRVQTVRQRLADNVDPLIGKSPAMLEVLELAELAANNNSPVLLLGETGTGKGLLARWIHRHSALKSSPFVEVNCSALRGDLLATELFGHVKGAFTSAVQDRQGLLDAADGGTLFLDEIGDMDLTVQTQFLKVVEEKHYRRVGEVKLRKSDFRLICATNRNLQQDIEQGRFRKDLYFRIFIFPIEIPPLRERLEDIDALSRFFTRQIAPNSEELPETIVNMMREYDWPGNIREMKNVIERALLLSQSRKIEAKYFSVLLERQMPARSAKKQSILDPSGDEDDAAAMQIILQALNEASAGLTRTEISGLFGHHKTAQDITRLLSLLDQRRLVRKDKKPTAGRPAERWYSLQGNV